VTRDSDTTFKVKGQGHQASLLSTVLTPKAAAVVSVGTYSAWESTATLCLLGGARGAWTPTAGGEGRGHIVSPRAQYVTLRAKLSGAVYCNRSCLFVRVFVCGFVCHYVDVDLATAVYETASCGDGRRCED